MAISRGSIAGRVLITHVRMLVEPARQWSLVSDRIATAADLVEAIAECDVLDNGVLAFERLPGRIAAIRLDGRHDQRTLEILVPLPAAMLPDGDDVVLGKQFVRNSRLNLEELATLGSVSRQRLYRLTVRPRRIVAQSPSFQAEVKIGLLAPQKHDHRMWE